MDHILGIFVLTPNDAKFGLSDDAPPSRLDRSRICRICCPTTFFHRPADSGFSPMYRHANEWLLRAYLASRNSVSNHGRCLYPQWSSYNGTSLGEREARGPHDDAVESNHAFDISRRLHLCDEFAVDGIIILHQGRFRLNGLLGEQMETRLDPMRVQRLMLHLRIQQPADVLEYSHWSRP